MKETADMSTYEIVRFYLHQSREPQRLESGLTLEEAQEHCSDSETSSSTATSDEAQHHTIAFGPWFDGFREE